MRRSTALALFASILATTAALAARRTAPAPGSKPQDALLARKVNALDGRIRQLDIHVRALDARLQELTAAVQARRPAVNPQPFDRDAEVRRLTALAAGLQGSVQSQAAKIAELQRENARLRAVIQPPAALPPAPPALFPPLARPRSVPTQ